jgi:phosphopantothenoylcysteine synthetase/decarboxylase
VIHAAAVSDFHVSRIISGKTEIPPSDGKLPSNEKLVIELEPNFKILPRLKGYSGLKKPKVVGFKFTATDKIEERKKAVNKLFAEGGVDAVIHNDHADIAKSKGLHSFTYHSSTEKLLLPNRLALAERLGNFFRTSFNTNSEEFV